MKCTYCGNEVDEAAEFFEVVHHKPWDESQQYRVFCSHECIRGYVHAEHFSILFQEEPPREVAERSADDD